MREFKFRAWYPQEENRMEYQDNKTPDWVGDILTDSYYYVPMQYTGLKDKNGKEIYEGDVLYNGHYRTRVYWNEHAGSWSHKSTNVDDALYIYIASNTTLGQKLLFEIIGNIYENPELIK